MSLTIPEVYAKAGTEQIALVQDENIYYIVMNTKYNMIDPAMITKFNEFLDIIEASKGPAICVTIGAGTKAFSSGFNIMEAAKRKNLQPLIGNSKVITEIKKVISTRSEGGSFILHGSSGVGKSTCAYQMAQYLINNFIDSEENATSILNLYHPDFFVVDGDDAENGIINVDAIRSAIEFSRYKPIKSANKVIIIDKADQLNINASNALLKLLEEPNTHTFIFIICDVLGRMLPTLRSRCIKFRFHALNQEEFSTLSTGKNINDDSIYNITSGSLTLLEDMKESDSAELYDEIASLFQDNKRPYDNVLRISDKAAKTTHNWLVAKRAILKYMSNSILECKDKAQLERKLDFYNKVKDLFVAEEIYNLDKKAIIANIFS